MRTEPLLSEQLRLEDVKHGTELDTWKDLNHKHGSKNARPFFSPSRAQIPLSSPHNGLTLLSLPHLPQAPQTSSKAPLHSLFVVVVVVVVVIRPPKLLVDPPDRNHRPPRLGHPPRLPGDHLQVHAPLRPLPGGQARRSRDVRRLLRAPRLPTLLLPPRRRRPRDGPRRLPRPRRPPLLRLLPLPPRPPLHPLPLRRRHRPPRRRRPPPPRPPPPHLLPPPPPSTLLRVVREVTRAVGSAGMAAGQLLDLEAEEGKELKCEDSVIRILEKKLGEMAECSAVCGGLIGGATDEEVERLRRYGRAVGVLYRVADDVLVTEGDEGSGMRSNASVVGAMGIDGAMEVVEELRGKAKRELEEFGDKYGDRVLPLYSFVDYAAERGFLVEAGEVAAA